MKRIALVLLVATAPLAVTACGSEPQEPVEQIVIRAPGETDPVTMAPPQGADMSRAVAAGKAAFASCAACHSAAPDGAAGFGPNLYGVVGRAAGTVEGFAYSSAVANSGLTWDRTTLDEFLTNPSMKIPGTTMTAGAVADDERRAAIIAYLASLSQ